MTTISGGRYMDGRNHFLAGLHPLPPDDKRQLVRMLEDIRKMVGPDWEHDFEHSVQIYESRFARDAQEVRLCKYLSNLIRARCYPYLSYRTWLSGQGLSIGDVLTEHAKFQDAQLRWVDSLVEEFTA